MPHYHIIGDIHGQAEKLECLLERLGYAPLDASATTDSETRELPICQAVFVGDFIDRGPQNRRVIEIVRRLVERGDALAVMGNHEFNAISYHTNHPSTGLPLRAHSEKNRAQHQSFLEEYPYGSDEAREVIDWFKTLPLFLELETTAGLKRYEVDGDGAIEREQFASQIRIVHACWDDEQIAYLKQRLGELARIDETFLLEASEPQTKAFTAVETLLKGPELSLPVGVHFFDKDGHRRERIRYKWWAGGSTYRETAIVPVDQQKLIPELPLPADGPIPTYRADAPPVFFGHYWMEGEPQPQRHNVACLDYSAGKDGPLAAYMWFDGDSRLGAGRLRGDQFLTSDDAALFDEQAPYTFPEELLRAASEVSADNDIIRKSERCACFYCFSFFPTSDLGEIDEEWVQCPVCGMDFVIGSASGLPLTRRYLAEANRLALQPAGDFDDSTG